MKKVFTWTRFPTILLNISCLLWFCGLCVELWLGNFSLNTKFHLNYDFTKALSRRHIYCCQAWVLVLVMSCPRITSELTTYGKFNIFCDSRVSVDMLNFGVDYLRISQAFFMHFSNISQAFLKHFSSVSQAILKRFSCISQVILKHLLRISQTFVKHFSNVFQGFMMRFSSICQAFLKHFLIVSQAFFKHFSSVFHASRVISYFLCEF